MDSDEYFYEDGCGYGYDYESYDETHDSNDDIYYAIEDSARNQSSSNNSETLSSQLKEPTVHSVRVISAQDGHVIINPGTLLDMSACIVGKHLTWQQIELHQPALDENLLEKICYWAFPWRVTSLKSHVVLVEGEQRWNAGCKSAGDVKQLWQAGFMVIAIIYKKQYGRVMDETVRVTLNFEKQELITSSCSNCNEVWCSHVVAALYYRIMHPKEVVVTAPMTDALSTLDRNQLQKLVQCMISADPGHILGQTIDIMRDLKDSKSELSLMTGAPDPTSAICADDVSTKWKETLTTIEKSLAKGIVRNYRGIHVGYDVIEKRNFALHEYLLKVIPFISNGQNSEAAQVLKCITTSVIQNVKCTDDNKKLRMAIHDIDRFYATLIVFNARKDVKFDDCLRQNIQEAQQQLTGRFPDLKRLESSQCAEMPPLHETFSVALTDAKGHDWHFPQASAALHVPPPPQSFTQLVSGMVIPKHSDYQEPLAVMLLRMEAMMLLGSENGSAVAEKIMQYLVEQLLQVSAVKRHWPSCTVESLLDAKDLHTLRNTKLQFGNTADQCSPEELADSGYRDILDGQKTLLSRQNEVTFALLLTLRLFSINYKCEDALTKGFLHCASLLGVEMSDNLLSKSTNHEESAWLGSLVKSVWNYGHDMKGLEESSLLRNFLTSFLYQAEHSSCGPLMFISMLCSPRSFMESGTKNQQDIFGHLCVQIFLRKLTDPPENSQLSSAVDKICDHCLRSLHVMGSAHHGYLKQIIETVIDSKDFNKMQTVMRGIQWQHLDVDDEFKQKTIFKFVAHFHLTCTYDEKQSSYNFDKVVNCLDVKCLKYDDGRWADDFSPDELVDFLVSIKQISDETLKAFPENVFKILIGASALSQDLGKIEVLLGYLSRDSPQYRTILDTFVSGHQDISFNTYLRLALVLLKSTSGNKKDQSYVQFRSHLFDDGMHQGMSLSYCNSSYGLHFTSMTDTAFDFVMKAFQYAPSRDGQTWNKFILQAIMKSCLDVPLHLDERRKYVCNLLDATIKCSNTGIIATCLGMIPDDDLSSSDKTIRNLLNSGCLHVLSAVTNEPADESRYSYTAGLEEILRFLLIERPPHKTILVKNALSIIEIANQAIGHTRVDFVIRKLTSLLKHTICPSEIQMPFTKLMIRTYALNEGNPTRNFVASKMFELVAGFDEDCLALVTEDMSTALSRPRTDHLLHENVCKQLFGPFGGGVPYVFPDDDVF